MNYREEADRRRRNAIANAISNTLLKSNTTGTSQLRNRDTASLELTSDLAFASAMEMVHNSKDLIKEYEETSELFASAGSHQERLIAEAWQSDVDRTARILQIGRKQASKNLEKVLGVERVETHAAKGQTGRLEGEDDVEDGGLPVRECDLGLQTTLKYAERGIKRLTKGLPDELTN